jgi:GNAT superfamily N-acetyltransferase
MTPLSEITVCEPTEEALEATDQLLWEILWEPVGLPRDVRQRFKLPGSEVIFVAMHRKQLVGTVVGQSQNEREMELRHLAVRPDMQGNGVGRGLVAKLVEYSLNHGYISISTHARNTSQTFFEKHGFQPVPGETLTHPVFDKHGISFLLMRRLLKQS